MSDAATTGAGGGEGEGAGGGGGTEGGEGEATRAQERIQELVAARKAEEHKAVALQAQLTEMRELVARLSTKTETEEEWTDPADKALAEVAKLREDLNRQTSVLAQQDGLRQIEKAVSKFELADKDAATSRMAERWFLAQQHQRGFDAAAEAKAIYDAEQQLLAAARKGWVQNKKDDAAATASAVSGPSPPVTMQTKPAPTMADALKTFKEGGSQAVNASSVRETWKRLRDEHDIAEAKAIRESLMGTG